MTPVETRSWEELLPVFQSRPRLGSCPGAEEREWTWDHNRWGHEGVCIQHSHRSVLWYSHRINPHAGGGAGGASYEDFMKSGGGYHRFTPPEVLEELFDTVRFLMQ